MAETTQISITAPRSLAVIVFREFTDSDGDLDNAQIAWFVSRVSKDDLEAEIRDLSHWRSEKVDDVLELDAATAWADCVLVPIGALTSEAIAAGRLPNPLSRMIHDGMAVIGLGADGDGRVQMRVLWSGFAVLDETITTELALCPYAEEDGLAAFLASFAGSHGKEDARTRFSGFMAEKIPRYLLRLEYQILLMITAFRGVRMSELFPAWGARRKALMLGPDTDGNVSIDVIADRADTLANVYAQKFRSSSVGRFALSAIAAVGAAIMALLLPEQQAEAFALELAATIIIIVSFLAATKGNWQSRWLEQRYLAERLRLMRNLPQAVGPLLLGRRWRTDERFEWSDVVIDRVARASLDVPIIFEPDRTQEFADALQDLIEDQIRYNRESVAMMSKMETRLGRVGMLFFVASMSLALVAFTLTLKAPNVIENMGNLLLAALAFFPAAGAAVFGIRVQSHFKMEAVHAQQILDRLKTLKHDVDAQKSSNFQLTLRHAKRFIAIQNNDLENWRHAKVARALDLP